MNTDNKKTDPLPATAGDDQKSPALGPQTPKEDTAIVTTTSGTEAVEEFGGRDGPDPTRYGDWENKGILSDF